MLLHCCLALCCRSHCHEQRNQLGLYPVGSITRIPQRTFRDGGYLVQGNSHANLGCHWKDNPWGEFRADSSEIFQRLGDKTVDDFKKNTQDNLRGMYREIRGEIYGTLEQISPSVSLLRTLIIAGQDPQALGWRRMLNVNKLHVSLITAWHQ